MQRCSKKILVIAITVVMLWLSTTTQAEETLLRWKNGDSLSGKLLESKAEKVRWKSPYFLDELTVDINVLDSIIFPKQPDPTTGTFRVGTVSGGIWTADIIDSDENTFTFANKRYSKFRVKRTDIYSLENREHTNLLFDGAQFTAWESIKGNMIKRERKLSHQHEHTDWHPDRSGHPQTKAKKTHIFHPIQWPERFEIDLELASTSRPPGFVFALGKNLYEALRLETWVNELVIVQGTLFEPIMTIEPGRRNFRLRLAYDQSTGVLKVSDLNGNLLLELKEVHPTVESSGLYIYNRGQDLTVRRLRVYRQPAGAKTQQIDFSKPRIHMMNGDIFYGKLFVEKDKSYVLSPDGMRQDINLQQVDRIVQPGMTLATIDDQATLTYIDGAVVQGKVVQLNPDSVLLQPASADEPITCSLTGASVLRFGSKTENKNTIKDYDKLFFPSGNLSGHVTFNGENGSNIQWQAAGTLKPVRVDNNQSPRIQRNSKRISRLQPFDVKMFPHLLHLKNGEVIPCQVLSYDDTGVSFRSPFISATHIDSSYMKGIEFSLVKTHARRENRNPITITGGDKHRIILEDGRILDAVVQRAKDNKNVVIKVKTDKQGLREGIQGQFVEVVVGGEGVLNDAVALKRGDELMFDPLEIQTQKLDPKLERALTVPRFNRDNPPNHILVANNGDLMRGTLLNFNGQTIQFDSNMNKITLPINRITRVVNISAEKEAIDNQQSVINKDGTETHQEPQPKDESQKAQTTQSVVRFALIHNPIMIFEPTELRGDKLFGHSPIYGEVSVPVNSIQYIHFGDKAKSFKSIFQEWVARPAKEPDYGEDR